MVALLSLFEKDLELNTENREIDTPLKPVTCELEPTVKLKTRYKQRSDPRTSLPYYEHRAIAEWTLGRPLLPGEVVHHVKGDTRDNHPKNIWAFSSQRAHMIFHNYVWQEQRGKKHLFTVEEVLQSWGEERFR